MFEGERGDGESRRRVDASEGVLTMVGLGGVDRRVVVLGRGPDRRVVLRRAVHGGKVLTVVLRDGYGALLSQDVGEGPARRHKLNSITGI